MADMNLAEQLHEKVLNLQNQILANDPTLPVLLRTIHQQLKADPAMVTILSDEEVGIVVTGLMKHTKVEITAAVVGAAKKKSLKNIDLDDL